MAEVTSEGRRQEILPSRIKLEESAMTRYGPQRLQLARFLRDHVLPAVGVPWILDSGTLLGAWRNGKFIPHDDDFDILLLYDDLDHGDENFPERLKELDRIRRIVRARLPTHYDARIVTTYTEKIEVFEPGCGKYILPSPEYRGADFHHVTVDLQLSSKVAERQVYHHSMYPASFPVDALFPLGSLVLEGEKFPAPRDAEAALVGLYGSLDPRAKFNPITRLYELEQ